jgi:hypothetical protein
MTIMKFHIDLFCTKAIIMLNSMLPKFNIMKIIKIINIKFINEGMDLKYTKTCSFHMEQNVEI